MKQLKWLSVLTGSFFWIMTAVAEEPSTPAAAASAQHKHGPVTCAEPTLKCATSVTPAFSGDGRLWLVWTAGGTVSVASSTNKGKSFSEPVMVGPHVDKMDSGADSRPQLLIDRQDRMTVAWAVFKDDKYNAQIYVVSSQDHGAHFSEAQPLSDNPVGQRFPVLGNDHAGNVFAAWIDKRNVSVGIDGKKTPGAALAYSWSKDGGISFAPAQIADQPVCECCRLGLAMTADDNPVLVYRKIFDGSIRDHAILTFEQNKPGQALRVSDDAWAINGCPHHGPSMAIAHDGSYHVAWFTQGANRQGVFYAHKKADAPEFSAPLAIGAPGKMAGRPYLLANANTLWLAWKESVEKKTYVYAQFSRDNGLSWSKPRRMGETSGYSDHPLLINNQKQTYLSWFTHDEGYRLLPLGVK